MSHNNAREEIIKIGRTNDISCEMKIKSLRHKDDSWNKIFRKCAGISYMGTHFPVGNAIAFRYLGSQYIVNLHFHSRFYFDSDISLRGSLFVNLEESLN